MDEVRAWNFTQGFEAAKLAGLNDYEMLQLRQRWATERDRELRRRVQCVPKILRHRIDWDAAIENLIPVRPPDITPCRGYMVLPVRTMDQEEETNVLIMPPVPQKPVEIRWPWSSEFLPWLMSPNADYGLEWLRMMVEEFGLPEDAQHAWASPHAGASVLDIRKHAAFYRELEAARLIEARKRLETIAGWLANHGLDGAVHCNPHAVILGAEVDYDPEISIFIFPANFRRDTYCLFLHPAWGEPKFVVEPFEEAMKIVHSSEWITQQAWLENIYRESKS